MQKLFVMIAIAAAAFGIFWFASPAPAPNGYGPKCPHFCGSPEPDACTGQCEYWDTCSPHCRCKTIPNRTP